MQGPLVIGSVQSDWLKFEEDLRWSRDNIVVKSGSGILVTGSVLGKIAVGTGAAVMDGANTGNGTFGAITVGAGALPGPYTVTFTAATKFDVEDPNGVPIGSGTTGVAFNKSGVGFTITAGATPHVAGDRAVVTIAPGTGLYVPFDPAGTTGAQHAAGILTDGVDATSADQPAAAVVRHAHVAPTGLAWIDGVTTNQKNAALAELKVLGILTVREA